MLWFSILLRRRKGQRLHHTQLTQHCSVPFGEHLGEFERLWTVGGCFAGPCSPLGRAENFKLHDRSKAPDVRAAPRAGQGASACRGASGASRGVSGQLSGGANPRSSGRSLGPRGASGRLPSLRSPPRTALGFPGRRYKLGSLFAFFSSSGARGVHAYCNVIVIGGRGGAGITPTNLRLTPTNSFCVTQPDHWDAPVRQAET